MSEKQYIEVVLDADKFETSLKSLESSVNAAKTDIQSSVKEIAGALASLGKETEKSLKDPFEMLGTSGSQISSTISAASKLGETIIKSLGSASGVAQSVTQGIQGVGTAASSVSTGIQAVGATFNTTMAAINLAVVAITTIVQIVGELTKASEEYQALADEAKEFKESAEEATTASEKQLDVYKKQEEQLPGLLNSLYGLEDANKQEKLTLDEKKTIIGQLNATYEGLGLSIDDTSGKLNKGRDEVERYATSILALGQAQQQQQLYEQASSNYAEAYTQKAIAFEKVIESLRGNWLFSDDTLDNLTMESAEAIGLMEKLDGAGSQQILSGDTQAAVDAFQDWNTTLETSNETMEKLQGTMNDTNIAALEGFEARMNAGEELTETELANMQAVLDQTTVMDEAERARYQQMIDSSEQAAKAEEARLAAQIEAVQESYDTISSLQAQDLEQRILNGEELSELEEAQLERFREIQDERVSIATNGNERINLSDQISLEQRTANMEHNNEVLKGFDDNMDHLRKVGDETLQAYLNSIDIYSEEGMAIVAQLANGISTTGEMSDEVKNFLAAWAESMTTSTEEVGGAVEDAAEDVGSTMGEEMNPQEASDTTKTYFDAAINMVTVKGAELKNKMKDAMQDAMDAADRKASPGNWRSIGQSLMSGIIGGVRSKRESLTGAIKDCIDEAVREAKKAAGINSPSRLFAREIGLPISEGMALGVTQGAGMLERALDDTIRNTALGVDPVVFRDISSAFAGAAAGTGSRTVNSNITFQVNGDITAVQRRRIVQDVRRELGRLVN